MTRRPHDDLYHMQRLWRGQQRADALLAVQGRGRDYDRVRGVRRVDLARRGRRPVQGLRESMVGVQKDMASLKKDVDSQWNAIDSIGAGSLKGK